MSDLFLLLAALAVHELGHYLCAKIAGVPLVSFSVTPIGLRLSFDFSCAGYLAEAFVHAGGSIFGILAGIIAAAFPIRAAHVFCGLSLSFGVINLLPVRFFDGGGIVSAILSQFFLPDTVWRVSRAVSLGVLSVLWAAVLWSEMRIGANLALLCFVCGAMLAELFQE